MADFNKVAEALKKAVEDVNARQTDLGKAQEGFRTAEAQARKMVEDAQGKVDSAAAAHASAVVRAKALHAELQEHLGELSAPSNPKHISA